MAPDDKQLLRDKGLQVTAQRLAVMRSVSAHPHSTANQVVEDVATQIGSVSRQAVYDALEVLADRGLIRRIQPARSPARYEDRADDNHHHMVCRRCSITVDVDCVVGDPPCLRPENDHGFDIDEAEVIFWGICPNCRDGTTDAASDANVHQHTRSTHR
jgi:Fur family ferric uptake transcriptional regulator